MKTFARWVWRGGFAAIGGVAAYYCILDSGVDEWFGLETLLGGFGGSFVVLVILAMPVTVFLWWVAGWQAAALAAVAAGSAVLFSPAGVLVVVIIAHDHPSELPGVAALVLSIFLATTLPIVGMIGLLGIARRAFCGRVGPSD
ncbi:MAG: hypothetical protein HQ495_05245 [Alphaproteobacteria bacterium]|nr:hypothetical protein [Alphaproteobacteria bacterium]